MRAPGHLPEPTEDRYMVDKKQLLANAWSSSGLARISLRAGFGPRRALLVLAYHRVLDIGDEDGYPADPELVSATVADFDWQMRWLREHFSPMTFRQVIECEERGLELPDRSVIVTFDDGHIDNYTLAFPVLRSAGVPATIFLSTDYVGGRRPFWFDRVARILYRAKPGSFELKPIGYRGKLSDVHSRRLATSDVLRALKHVPESTRLACLDELGAHEDSVTASTEDPRAFAMDWDQVREMARSGIEFGSHTVSHPILANVNQAQLVQELVESRSAIETHTGRPVEVIAYPIGKRFAYDDRVIAACKDAGYRLAVSYESGVNAWPLPAPFELRRLAVERYTDRAMFESLLSLPRFFGRWTATEA
jgi:peptidoglycan/xylan/chitin deacetylase (PgdA/CDA1 family)